MANGVLYIWMSTKSEGNKKLKRSKKKTPPRKTRRLIKLTNLVQKKVTMIEKHIYIFSREDITNQSFQGSDPIYYYVVTHVLFTFIYLILFFSFQLIVARVDYGTPFVIIIHVSSICTRLFPGLFIYIGTELEILGRGL
jgi:hypothetical protein